MDHALYDYSALPLRRATPDGAGTGLSAFALLFLEHWEPEPLPGTLRDPRMVGEFGSYAPDYRSWTQREYGLRIGIFRVIDALRAAGIRPAIAANAMALQRLPRLVQTFNDWGCEWIAHGVAATRMMHSGMDLDAQRAHIAQSIEAVHQCTGVAALGWLSQDWGTTPDTPRLLAEAGIRYTLDWCNDDQALWLHTAPPVLSIPLSAEWDDVQCQWLRHVEPRAHARLAQQAFLHLRDEAALRGHGTVFGLPIHPWLSGMPSRIQALRDLLTALRSAPDVRWCQPSDILEAATRRPRNGLP